SSRRNTSISERLEKRRARVSPSRHVSSRPSSASLRRALASVWGRPLPGTMQSGPSTSSSTGWARSPARKAGSTSTSSRRESVSRSGSRSSQSATSSASSPVPKASRITRTSCVSLRNEASRPRKSMHGSSGGPRKARSIAPRKTNISSSNGCSRDPADAHPDEGLSPGERDSRRRGRRGPDRQDVPRREVQDRSGQVLRGRRRLGGGFRFPSPARDDRELRREADHRGGETRGVRVRRRNPLDQRRAPRAVR